MFSLDNEPRIKLDGVDGVFILMNNEGRDGENGPVTTQEDVNRFVPGIGHMYDGVISRYGQVFRKKGEWHYVQEVDDV